MSNNNARMINNNLCHNDTNASNNIITYLYISLKAAIIHIPIYIRSQTEIYVINTIYIIRQRFIIEYKNIALIYLKK